MFRTMLHVLGGGVLFSGTWVILVAIFIIISGDGNTGLSVVFTPIVAVIGMIVGYRRAKKTAHLH